MVKRSITMLSHQIFMPQRDEYTTACIRRLAHVEVISLIKLSTEPLFQSRIQ